jgi:hypothetical protein
MINENGEHRLITEHKAFMNEARKFQRELAERLKEDEKFLSWAAGVAKEIEAIQSYMRGIVGGCRERNVEYVEDTQQWRRPSLRSGI